MCCVAYKGYPHQPFIVQVLREVVCVLLGYEVRVLSYASGAFPCIVRVVQLNKQTFCCLSFSLKLGMEKTFLRTMADGTSTIRSACIVYSCFCVFCIFMMSHVIFGILFFRGSLQLAVSRNGQWSTFLHDAMSGVLLGISSSVEA